MKIAIIGAGISGLGAGVILSPNHEVHLFEAQSRLGGHAHTVDVTEEPGKSVAADIGFLVFNEANYPHLTALFRYLGVETVDSSMTLSVRTTAGNIEWAGTNLNTIFGQRRNLFRPKFLRMLREILRFHREAENDLVLARRHGWSLGELLEQRDYAPEFCAHYLVPIGAAIWSTPEAKILEYPAETFLTFFLNHRLLQVNNRPTWKTVAGGSRQYVERARARISRVHLNQEVLSVHRSPDGVLLKTKDGEIRFDRVIFATHAPVTLRLLADASEHERHVLSAFSVIANRAVLHRDPVPMPARARLWSSWNVCAGAGDQVSLTYHLNQLQPLPTKRDYLLTLNPSQPLAETLLTQNFHHPRFNREAVRAQRDLPGLQGRGGVYFSGAWTRYGFHEDGLLSAVKVAELLHCSTPWPTPWMVA